MKDYVVDEPIRVAADGNLTLGFPCPPIEQDDAGCTVGKTSGRILLSATGKRLSRLVKTEYSRAAALLDSVKLMKPFCFPLFC